MGLLNMNDIDVIIYQTVLQQSKSISVKAIIISKIIKRNDLLLRQIVCLLPFNVILF